MEQYARIKLRAATYTADTSFFMREFLVAGLPYIYNISMFHVHLEVVCNHHHLHDKRMRVQDTTTCYMLSYMRNLILMTVMDYYHDDWL